MTGGKEWLPDLDSNQDKLNQNQLCYRYTIGQNAGKYTSDFSKIKPEKKKSPKKRLIFRMELDFARLEK